MTGETKQIITWTVLAVEDANKMAASGLYNVIKTPLLNAKVSLVTYVLFHEQTPDGHFVCTSNQNILPSKNVLFEF